MKSVGKQILVSVDLEQRSDYEIELGSGIRLWTNSKFGTDQKTVAPTVATVVHAGVHKFLYPGDRILCRHNTFNAVVNANGDLLGDTGVVDIVSVGDVVRRLHTFSIGLGAIIAKINTDGQLIPLPGWLIVKPVDITPESSLEIPDTARRVSTNTYDVVYPGPDCEGVLPGMRIITYDKSGVEVVYTHKAKPMRAYRCRYDDVLAIVNNENE